nr:MAG TPA: Dynein light chain type 1 [Caudoviricetes sp.]
MTLVCSCAPLRQTQTTSREQIETSDTTLTELIRREVESRFGTLWQTVVEFYPPDKVPHPSPRPAGYAPGYPAAENSCASADQADYLHRSHRSDRQNHRNGQHLPQSHQYRRPPRRTGADRRKTLKRNRVA